MIELRVYGLDQMHRIPAMLYWVLLAVFVCGMMLFCWRKGLKEGLRYGATLLLVEWTFLVLGITVLFRESNVERAINMIPLSSYLDYAENTYLMEKAAINILNVVLFIPIGMLLKLAFCNNDNHNVNVNLNWKGAMLVGFLISIAIEVSQFVFRKGLCEVDDVLHNVAGCMLGYGIATMTLRMWRKLRELSLHSLLSLLSTIFTIFTFFTIFTSLQIKNELI